MQLFPLFFAPDGSPYGIDGRRVRRIDAAGLITTVGGTGANGYNGDNLAPTATSLFDPAVVAVGPDGLLYIVEYGGKRIRRIAPALPGLSTAEMSIASDDGSAVFVFDSLGRHLRTIDAVTKRALLTFGYDGAGRLISLADADGNVTQVVRDAAGVATALVGPFGERTVLAVSGTSGFLASLTTATGDTTRFTYGATGLLGTMTTPKGAVYAFTYDTLGRLVKDENPAGGFKTLVRSDTVGRFTSTVATALGRTTVYRTEFLETGAIRRTRTDPAGLASVTTEAPDGAVAVTAADGMTLTSSAAADPRYGFQAPYTSALTLASSRRETYSQGMDYRERITIAPSQRGGKPCIRGLRITVDDVLSYLAAGMSEEEVLTDFPDLERDDFRAVYAFAADRERRLITDPAA